MDNIVIATFGTSKSVRTRSVWQWDYGQVLQFADVDLPTTYTVHFSNQPLNGEAKTVIGNADGVDIPDEYLTTGLPVYAWIFLHAGEADGETIYMASIPVQKRPKPVEDAPTPVQRGLIETALELLNDGVQAATQAAQAATSAAELLEHPNAVAETLEPGAQATANYADGTFSFGIPKGDKGDEGNTGATPNLTIGTVSTLQPNEQATVSISGTTSNPVLSFGIPKGQTGNPGIDAVASGHALVITHG